MPAIGLWSRSEKTRLADDTPRHSDQIGRSDISAPWLDSPSKRAASLDIPRSTPAALTIGAINTARNDRSARNSPRDVSPASRPTSSRKSRFKLKHHASDTNLSSTLRIPDDNVPPVPTIPPAPTIITTAPTSEPEPRRPTLPRKRSRLLTFTKSRPSTESMAEPRTSAQTDRKSESKKRKFPSLRPSRDPFADLQKLAGSRRELQNKQPDSHNSESPDAPDDSSREDLLHVDGSGREPDSGRPSGQFSWLSRKQKNRKSLFPLLADAPNQKPNTPPTTTTASPRPSTSALPPDPSQFSGPTKAESQKSLRGLHQSHAGAGTPSTIASISFAAHPTLLRTSSNASDRSTKSSPPLATGETKARHRASTLGSNSGQSEETPPTPPFASGGSGRNSTSTAGRSSFSNLFLNRFRQADAQSPRQSSTSNVPSGTGSMSNSMSMSRDAISLPDRVEGETAIHYLERVEDEVPRSQISCELSKKDDEFRHAVMRSFMRKFAYFGDPLDMAIRKLLLEIDLPKETQQIDRVLQSFADRYHECNPGIFNSAGEAYFIAFSILMLQTDFFNKNNKRKMTKPDYVKNSTIEGVCDDVLECFYDNIIYTPFIRVEDDQDIFTMRSRKTNRKTAKAAKAAKAAIKHVPSETNKRNHKEPLDPYTLIFESRLDTLRPSLKDVINLEDPYTYLGSLPIFDRRVLRGSKIGVIQIESARSRPDAFMSQSGIENPAEAKVGLVDLPIDKVGVLWRKDPKKKTARSPWQEWGAILTGAGLYFFKNPSWVKNYLSQYENHVKHGGAGTLCFFKPTITNFKPDYRLPTDHGVALQDATYKRHKNAFCFYSHNGSEVFLADSEPERDDWLAKLNHQAACKTAGIRPRGLLGGQYDGQRQRGIRRLEPTNSSGTQTVQTSTGEVTIQRGTIDQNLAQQINAARKEAMEQKICETELKLATSNKQLEDELRDARHLLILAPIQQKTREQLIQAAQRAQERLDSMRVENWRFTCHRDILLLDLEEGQREAERRQARIDKFSSRTSSTAESDSGLKINGINGTDFSKAVSVEPTNPAFSAKSPKHTPKLSQDSFAASTTDGNEDFHTPPESSTPTNLSPPQSPILQPANSASTPGSPHQKSPSQSGYAHRMSQSSSYSQTSRIQPRGPRSSLDVPETSSASEPIVNRDEETDTVKSELDDLPEDEVVSPSSRPRTPVTPKSVRDEPEDKQASPGVSSTPDRGVDRGRARRVSFNRRSDTEHKHHVRQNSRKSATGVSKETKDDTATDGLSLITGPSAQSTGSMHRSKPEKHDKDGEPTGLIRDKGSFTVHGKKASVVTLGGDWATGNPEETLQRIKSAAAAASPTAGPSGNSWEQQSLTGAHIKSPLSRMTSAEEDERRDDGESETTPTPGSPLFDRIDYSLNPPRNSSLRSKERTGTSARAASSAGMSIRSVETAIEDGSRRRGASVEA